MLVDDDDAILRLLRNVLKRFTSADIECHALPSAALAAFAAAPTEYELVLTDLEMPGMNGVELCRSLRAIAASQRIVLMTGSGAFSPASARCQGFSGMLPKPFPLETLRQTLATEEEMPATACHNN